MSSAKTHNTFRAWTRLICVIYLHRVLTPSRYRPPLRPPSRLQFAVAFSCEICAWCSTALMMQSVTQKSCGRYKLVSSVVVCAVRAFFRGLGNWSYSNAFLPPSERLKKKRPVSWVIIASACYRITEVSAVEVATLRVRVGCLIRISAKKRHCDGKCEFVVIEHWIHERMSDVGWCCRSKLSCRHVAMILSESCSRISGLAFTSQDSSMLIEHPNAADGENVTALSQIWKFSLGLVFFYQDLMDCFCSIAISIRQSIHIFL